MDDEYAASEQALYQISPFNTHSWGYGRMLEIEEERERLERQRLKEPEPPTIETRL